MRPERDVLSWNWNGGSVNKIICFCVFFCFVFVCVCVFVLFCLFFFPYMYDQKFCWLAIIKLSEKLNCFACNIQYLTYICFNFTVSAIRLLSVKWANIFNIFFKYLKNKSINILQTLSKILVEAMNNSVALFERKRG